MKREDLKSLGLADDVIDKIMAENGKDVEKARAGSAAKEAELAAANAKITELSESVKKYDGVDVEKLKQDVSDWQSKYNTDLTKLRLDHALESALKDAGAHDPATVLPKLDLSGVKLQDGKLSGLEEQLNKLRQDAGFLFKQDNPSASGPSVQSGLEHGSTPGSNALDAFVMSARSAAGLPAAAKQ